MSRCIKTSSKKARSKSKLTASINDVVPRPLVDTLLLAERVKKLEDTKTDGYEVVKIVFLVLGAISALIVLIFTIIGFIT